MPQLSNRKLPLNKTLAWRPRPKESCLRWEKIITSVLIPCLSPRRLGWTRYHDADQHWHRIVEHLKCGLKNLRKNIDLFFSLFLFKGVWKFLVSNIFWSPPISWWLQWLQNCQPPSFEKNATFIHKESPILDASGVLKCLRPHSLGWFKGEPTGNYGCP